MTDMTDMGRSAGGLSAGFALITAYAHRDGVAALHAIEGPPATARELELLELAHATARIAAALLEDPDRGGLPLREHLEHVGPRLAHLVEAAREKGPDDEL